MRKLQKNGTAASALLDDEDGASVRFDSARPESSSPQPVRSAVGHDAGEISRPRSMTDAVRPRRELVDDYADDADTEAYLRASGRARRIRRGLIPQTKTGRIAAAVGALSLILAICAGGAIILRYLTTSEKFRIPSSSSIEMAGNSHLSRAQLLSVFGEDIERNIFAVPLDERRHQLEQMPWVAHATVMRLLPNRIRVQVSERVPVAFVRQGGTIGMVDAEGVLLDIPPDAPGNPNYSFPVVTGLKADDEPRQRARRMKLFAAFLKDLDSDGKGISAQLSEVDLLDPEDVKALIPDHNAEVLVHFGDAAFLSRYRKFEDHIGEWRTQYPRLSSVDMRYERQVVLQMPQKDATVTPAADAGTQAAKAGVAAVSATTGALPPSGGRAVTVKATQSMHTAPSASRPTVDPTAATATTKRPTDIKAAHVSLPESKDAAMRKRVEAIKAWMARREKLRNAAAGNAADAGQAN